MIYIDEHIDDFDLQEALATVSAQRRAQALRYRFERDQRLCLAAYRLLRRALWLEYGIQEMPEFTYDSNGKPQLNSHDIRFSLSHCSNAVACAVSDSPVGIDIETMDHYSPEVAARVMSRQEIEHITHSSEPAVTFTRLWTMKESLYKLTGNDTGDDIAGMLEKAELYDFNTIIHPTFIVTSCQLKGTGPNQ